MAYQVIRVGPWALDDLDGGPGSSPLHLLYSEHDASFVGESDRERLAARAASAARPVPVNSELASAASESSSAQPHHRGTAQLRLVLLQVQV